VNYILTSYQEIYLNSDNMDFIISKRLEMVRYANENGYQRTAKYYSCTRKTIKKWCKRYNLYGIKGLKNISRRPKNSPRIIDSDTINLIVDNAKEAKYKGKHITAKNIRRKIAIRDYSNRTINRYINKAIGKKRNKKHPKTNGGSVEWKQYLKPFQLIQIDIKYLTDIDNLRPYFNEVDNELAKYQITAKDVATGFPIIAYCDEKSVTHTTIFLETILYPFLKQFKELDLKSITIQTDNGVEFTNKYLKTRGKEATTTSFTLFILEHFKRHKTIIPGHCTAQSDVELFHWSIERDCLGWDDITNNEELIKATTDYIERYISENITTRGYSPLEKIKETLDVTNITFPKPQILSVKVSTKHR
jgi:hypothetical protein